MSLMPIAGQKIFIGGAAMEPTADDFVEADFSGVTWTEIDGWQQAGAIGDAAQTITSELINRGRDVKQKGTANAGSMQNVFVILSSDAGQTALLAAAAGGNKSNYPFKIEWPDAATSPSSPTPQPTKRLFVGLVTTAQEAGGGANTIATMNVTIEVNSNVVKVAKNP